MNGRGAHRVLEGGRRHAPAPVVRGETSAEDRAKGPNPERRGEARWLRTREGTDQRELGAGPVDSERDVIAELGERSGAAGRL